ncbi:carboxylesterase family protein [Portibacter marinus]|uniref:carboxylesterase family protein n=1 Tax=Portibacter marinus TaxID=2898660 RepID=UPI001F16C9B5|nr:dienelactone hydrolase family protein [Portibacter marinus]
MRLSAVVFFMSMLTILNAQQNGEYIPLVYSDGEGGVLNYNILYPKDFDDSGSKKYPLMLFLHGAGERGSDNEAQLIHGAQVFKDSLEKYPAVVIFPQCPKDSYWVDLRSEGTGQGRNMKIMTEQGPNPALRMVMELINQTLDQSYIDKDRFYVAGLSMGGMGTIELGWRMSDQIAAAIAICGAGPSDKATEMADVPFWFIHGVDDNVVPSRYSLMMLRAMQVNGGKARITLYPETGHNSWDKAFADPEFFSWMFDKRR